MFKKGNSFLRVRLKEKCALQGMQNVQGQIWEPIFFPYRGSCGYHPSNNFAKMFTNVVLLTAFAFHFSVFSGRTLRTKKHVSFFCNNPKMAPYLEYDFKGRLIVVDIKFWKLGNITLGVYSLIFPSFCGDVFSCIML